MVKDYPTFVAIRHRGAKEPRLFCETLRLNKKQGLRLRAINGNFECLLRGDVLTVLPTRQQFPGQELLNLSNLPASESYDYNKALAWVAAHPEDFPVIPGPEKPRPPESHDDRIYRLFNAAPKSGLYVQDHILAECLTVPVPDLVAALQRHGFDTEEVTHEGVLYLKLTRPDGAEFSFDWNGPGSNFYDGYDPMVQPVTRVAELRQLPYALEGIGFFCAIWWDRAVGPGEVPRRLVSAWPLMDSEGPRDLSPTVREVLKEHAEKQRIAGLDEENKKLKEELAQPRWTMEEILQAFGEVETWDSCYIDEKFPGDVEFSTEMYVSDIMAALLRQRGLPEGDSSTREAQAQNAVKAAWDRKAASK